VGAELRRCWLFGVLRVWCEEHAVVVMGARLVGVGAWTWELLGFGDDETTTSSVLPKICPGTLLSHYELKLNANHNQRNPPNVGIHLLDQLA
jgi:hypothetical protein